MKKLNEMTNTEIANLSQNEIQEQIDIACIEEGIDPKIELPELNLIPVEKEEIELACLRIGYAVYYSVKDGKTLLQHLNSYKKLGERGEELGDISYVDNEMRLVRNETLQSYTKNIKIHQRNHEEKQKHSNEVEKLNKLIERKSEIECAILDIRRFLKACEELDIT